MSLVVALICGLLATAPGESPAPSDTAPPKPGLGADVRVRVTPRISHDKRADTWTYSFKVENLRESPGGVWSFSLEQVPPRATTTGPKGWHAEQADSLLNWMCTDPGPPPKTKTGNVHPSPFDIQPGSSTVFSFTCRVPPGDSLYYYVHGFHPLPEPKTDDEIAAALDTPYNFFADAVHGRALGPKRAR